MQQGHIRNQLQRENVGCRVRFQALLYSPLGAWLELKNLYTNEIFVFICNLQFGEMVHHRATFFESTYFKWANFQNTPKIWDLTPTELKFCNSWLHVLVLLQSPRVV